MSEHVPHLSSVIRRNAQRLQHLNTSANHFTSEDVGDLNPSTSLCSPLVAVEVGGSKCTDCTQNTQTISTVLSSCKQLQVVLLRDFRMGNDGLLQLRPYLTKLYLAVLALLNTGLSVNLSFNTLTDACLSAVQKALSQCTSLEEVYLTDSQLTSESLAVLATALPKWPKLKRLRLCNNDFSRADRDTVAHFLEALRTCRSLQLLEMPKAELLSEDLKQGLSASGLNVKFLHGRLWYK